MSLIGPFIPPYFMSSLCSLTSVWLLVSLFTLLSWTILATPSSLHCQCVWYYADKQNYTIYHGIFFTNFLVAMEFTSASVSFFRYFRVVPASLFLQKFASDRRHMRRDDGTWMHPPPPLSPISTPGQIVPIYNLNGSVLLLYIISSLYELTELT